jgi:hypothetical protein
MQWCVVLTWDHREAHRWTPGLDVSPVDAMIARMDVTPDLVTEATSVMQRALGGGTKPDWHQAAGDLPIEATVLDDATPEDLLRSIVMCGELLRLAVASASPEARAWHPYGTSDPLGFAAMGIVEVLVHTHDIARGLTIDWAPPGMLCEPVLRRLFPAAPRGDPSQVLLWCTGRAALDGRPRLTRWRWESSVRD